MPPKKATSLPKTRYAEIQEDELLVLSAIYGEDYKVLENAGLVAWSKSEPAFQITARSADARLAVVLRVTFVATYPKSLPILTLTNHHQLGQELREALLSTLDTKPKELLSRGEPMILEIVQALQDILDDFAGALAEAANHQLPSLDHERTNHLEQLQFKAAVRQQEALQRQSDDAEAAKEAAQDVMSELTPREFQNATEALRILAEKEDPVHGTKAGYEFFNNATEIALNRKKYSFYKLEHVQLVCEGPVTDCYVVRPLFDRLHRENSKVRIIMKVARIDVMSQFRNLNPNCEDDEFMQDLFTHTASFKTSLNALEHDLQVLKKFRHQNILNLFNYTLDEENDLWTAKIYTEWTDSYKSQTLAFLLGADTHFSTAAVRRHTIELIAALHWLHQKGILHRDIHINNIILTQDADGAYICKLADAGTQFRLHNLKGIKTRSTTTTWKNASWIAPELLSTDDRIHYGQKTDVWDLGLVVMQMLFGVTVLREFTSLASLHAEKQLTQAMLIMLKNMFLQDPLKRPRFFELKSYEWLVTNALVSILDQPDRDSRAAWSRFYQDFADVTKIGKGGFGEVHKARHRLDGKWYAVKTITQKTRAELSLIVQEVRVLSELEHPYVVRYTNTWVENPSAECVEVDLHEDEPSSGHGIEFGYSTATGGFDHISAQSQGVVFAIDSGDESDEESDAESSGASIGPGKPFSEEAIAADEVDDDPASRRDSDRDSSHEDSPPRTRPPEAKRNLELQLVLYIQMGFCEKQTLRDLIPTLSIDESASWPIFQQMVEGLAYLHSKDVVHRDLKPENIFINDDGLVKIGDFGLATCSQFQLTDKETSSERLDHNLSSAIGTFVYAAPEVRNANGIYTAKVDMYALGIMWFEMNYHEMVGMERVDVMSRLRASPAVLPKDFTGSEDHRSVTYDLILALLDHNIEQRPSAQSLLSNKDLPIYRSSDGSSEDLRSQIMRQDQKLYQKLFSEIFNPRQSNQNTSVQTRLALQWDCDTPKTKTKAAFMLQATLKTKLIEIFRRHGAVELSRSTYLPVSEHYGVNSARFIGKTGLLVQAPFDLKLPHARLVAKGVDDFANRSFVFGTVFRDQPGKSRPLEFGEVDFDIVSNGSELATEDAETIKVIDEIIESFDCLTADKMIFFLNHSSLLDIIYNYCGIEPSVRPAIWDCVGKLNIHDQGWLKVKSELKASSLLVSSASIAELQKFDFRDSLVQTMAKLKKLFEGTDFYEEAQPAFKHLARVLECAEHMGVKTKIIISPLSSLKARFYSSGVKYVCIFDSKRGKDVFAVGGRYDNLLTEYRSPTKVTAQHAVGFSFGWDRFATDMATSIASGKNKKSRNKRVDLEAQCPWTVRRCEVLIDGHDLGTTGLALLALLWRNDISAEITNTAGSTEDLAQEDTNDDYYWSVTLRQDSLVRVKALFTSSIDEVNLPTTQLVSWLHAEIRKRQNPGFGRAELARHASQQGSTIVPSQSQVVRVLNTETKSKKANRQLVTQQAQAQAAALASSMLSAPIASVEVTDKVLEQIRQTRLGDGEGWKQLRDSVPMAERRYIMDLLGLLQDMAAEVEEGEDGNAFVYSSRTGRCIYYDLRV